MPPKLQDVVGQTEREKSRSSCARTCVEENQQLGRYWLGQFADCSVRVGFAQVQLIR
jgi:hypothetical protein